MNPEFQTVAIPVYHFDPVSKSWIQSFPSLTSDDDDVPDDKSVNHVQLQESLGGTASTATATQNDPSDNHSDHSNHSSGTTLLSTLSFNVWFDPFELTTRYRSIMNKCNELRPDVICFQEVTRSFLGQLEQQKWYKEHYVTSDISQSFQSFDSWYGVLIAVKKTTTTTSMTTTTTSNNSDNGCGDDSDRIRLVNLCKTSLETRMGRTCITASLRVKDSRGKYHSVRVSTVHLESLSNFRLRRDQLSFICRSVLSEERAPHAILMGDFNFDDKMNWEDSHRSSRSGSRGNSRSLENDIFVHDEHVSQFVDVWPQLHPNDEGKTFDSTVNKMLRRYERMRYDRVIVRSRNNECIPKSIELVGTQCIKVNNDGVPVFPSDHFGLFTVFALV